MRQKDPELVAQLCGRLWDLAMDVRVGKDPKVAQCAPRLLREVMGLMDLRHMKDARCLFKLSRCALLLLQTGGATRGVHVSGVQAAYLNIAQTLFKYSQKEGNDSVFLTERLIEPLLEVLQSEAPECASNNLRIYVVGVLKNVSHDEPNQRVLIQCGAIATLFKLMNHGEQQLTGCSREAHLLVQITATLRNLASQQYKHFLLEERLDALVQVMALFPKHGELLTNVSRILSKLTLHGSACDAFARAEARVRQVARTLGANAESAPLVLRLSFVLGSLTEKSDRLRVMFAFDCEGTSLVPQLLRRYCVKSRELSSVDTECRQSNAAGLHDIDEVLVKLVRLLANIAINASVGATLASSSACVSPLLDLLSAKQITDSEELVLNVVAAVTNFLFYDTPSNLFFQDSNKPLLCKCLQPLLHAAYNVEALIETTRALGNLSRHADARQYMIDIRLDEALSVLLDHEDRDLVFYVCGVLVNLAAEPSYTSRLVDCCLVVPKLCTVLNDAPLDDPALRLVAVKVLTNLSLNPSTGWAVPDMEAVRCSLGSIIVDGDCITEDSAKGGVRAAGGANEKRQLVELAQSLVERLPSTGLETGEWANSSGNDDEPVV